MMTKLISESEARKLPTPVFDLISTKIDEEELRIAKDDSPFTGKLEFMQQFVIN